MPKLNIRRRRRSADVRAREQRRRRLISEAKATVDLVKASGVARHQSVIMLVFDGAEGDVTGFMNVDPIMAALALVEYLEQKYPRTQRRRTTTKARKKVSRPTRSVE